MTARYVAEFVGFIVCLVLIYASPELALSAIVLSLPVIAVLSGVSVIYLRRIYRKQPRPRSRFFGMLVGVSARTWIGGVWIGYLTVGRVLDRMHENGYPVATVPVPPPNISSPISGLVVAYLMIPPIIYALNVWSVRRKAPGRTAEITELTLDRTDEEVV